MIRSFTSNTVKAGSSQIISIKSCSITSYIILVKFDVGILGFFWKNLSSLLKQVVGRTYKIWLLRKSNASYSVCHIFSLNFHNFFSLSPFHVITSGVIEVLVNGGRQIDAVNLAFAFELTEQFSPVPLLKSYLKEARRASSQGKPGNASPTAQVCSLVDFSGARHENEHELFCVRITS